MSRKVRSAFTVSLLVYVQIVCIVELKLRSMLCKFNNAQSKLPSTRVIYSTGAIFPYSHVHPNGCRVEVRKTMV